MAIENWRSESCPRRPIEPDFEELEEKLEEEDHSQGPEFEPLFDPKAFVESHGSVDLASFKISKETLRNLAVKATEVRKNILDKSEAAAQFEPSPLKKREEKHSRAKNEPSGERRARRPTSTDE